MGCSVEAGPRHRRIRPGQSLRRNTQVTQLDVLFVPLMTVQSLTLCRLVPLTNSGQSSLVSLVAKEHIYRVGCRRQIAVSMARTIEVFHEADVASPEYVLGAVA